MSDQNFALGPWVAWQPIETAPKDGTPVDLWQPRIGRWTNMRWDYHNWMSGKPVGEKSWGGGSRDGPDAEPTHWMPVPAPPNDGVLV
jgi:hypothetical protein